MGITARKMSAMAVLMRKDTIMENTSITGPRTAMRSSI